MTKGTTSRGTRNDKTHILCRITGRRTYHIQKKRSSVRGRVSNILFFICGEKLFKNNLLSIDAIFQINLSRDNHKFTLSTKTKTFILSSTGPPKPSAELPQVLAVQST